MEVYDFNRKITAPDAFAVYAKDTLVIDFKKVGEVYRTADEVRGMVSSMNRRFADIEKVLNAEIAAFVALRERKPWYSRLWYHLRD